MSVDPLISLDSQKSTYNSLKRQEVEEVLDFSSQYGNENSISYTISNVVGEPTNYPAYGDFTRSLVFVSCQRHIFWIFRIVGLKYI